MDPVPEYNQWMENGCPTPLEDESAIAMFLSLALSTFTISTSIISLLQSTWFSILATYLYFPVTLTLISFMVIDLLSPIYHRFEYACYHLLSHPNQALKIFSNTFKPEIKTPLYFSFLKTICYNPQYLFLGIFMTVCRLLITLATICINIPILFTYPLLQFIQEVTANPLNLQHYMACANQLLKKYFLSHAIIFFQLILFQSEIKHAYSNFANCLIRPRLSYYYTKKHFQSLIPPLDAPEKILTYAQELYRYSFHGATLPTTHFNWHGTRQTKNQEKILNELDATYPSAFIHAKNPQLSNEELEKIQESQEPELIVLFKRYLELKGNLSEDCFISFDSPTHVLEKIYHKQGQIEAVPGSFKTICRDALGTNLLYKETHPIFGDPLPTPEPYYDKSNRIHYETRYVLYGFPKDGLTFEHHALLRKIRARLDIQQSKHACIHKDKSKLFHWLFTFGKPTKTHSIPPGIEQKQGIKESPSKKQFNHSFNHFI